MKKQSCLLEIIFENRNKSYGAYELRAQYENRLASSLCLAFLAILLLFVVPAVITRIFSEKQVKTAPVYAVTIDLTQDFLPEKHVPVKPQIHTASVKAPAADFFKVVKNEEAVTQPEVIQQEAVQENFTETGTVRETVVNNRPAVAAIEEAVSDEPMNSAVVDQAPTFPGGDKALYQFLATAIRYPAPAREMEIEGSVYASFIINAEGKIEKINILREPGLGTGAEVVRVLNTMPSWNPGIYKGKAVKTIYCLPVRFSLANG